MSGSESDSEGECDSINEDLEWLLKYACKFDINIDDIKQFITTTPSHQSSINNKKITSAIWNAFTSTSRADNSEGRHFNFKEDFPSETPTFCSPFHRYNWSTTGNSIGWTRTEQYSNSGTGCIKSPHLLSSTSNTKRYSDLIFECYHLYSKCTYLILSVHASLFEPIDRFTVFVDGEYQATIDATSAFEFVAIKVESKTNKKHTIKFRYEYNPFDLDTLPESPQGHLGAVFIDDVYFISTATDIELEMVSLLCIITYYMLHIILYHTTNISFIYSPIARGLVTNKFTRQKALQLCQECQRICISSTMLNLCSVMSRIIVILQTHLNSTLVKSSSTTHSINIPS